MKPDHVGTPRVGTDHVGTDAFVRPEERSDEFCSIYPGVILSGAKDLPSSLLQGDAGCPTGKKA